MTDTQPTPPPSRPGGAAGWLPAVLVAFSLLVFGWTVWEGRVLGLHRVLPISIDKHETSIAVAISQLRYGIGSGYVAYWNVHHALRNGGITDHPLLLQRTGLTFPENVQDHILMDQLLLAAANLPDAKDAGVMYCPIFAEDVGYVDFAKLGFCLFGYKLSALYSAYFVIMGVTLAAYLAAYRRDTAMLLLLVGVQISFFLVVRSLPEINPGGDAIHALQLGSVINGRFLATLGLIPFLHLAGAVLTLPRPTAGRVVFGVVQAAALGFALHLRGSVAWMYVVLAGTAVVPGLVWLWRNRRGALDRAFSLRDARRVAAGWWPVALCAAGLIGQKAYVSSAVHWTYHSDLGLPHHLVWHNAVMALELHPKWSEQSLNPGPGLSGDSLAVAVTEKMLDEQGFGKPFLVSPITNGYKARVHDRLCKEAYLKFVRENPGYMLELMCWYKPKQFWHWATEIGAVTLRGAGRPDAVCLLAAFALCLAAAGPANWYRPLVLSGCGAAGATVPFFWAYAHFHVMSEFLCLFAVFFATGAVALAGGGFLLARRRVLALVGSSARAVRSQGRPVGS